jgi:hypothetical protein
MMVMKSQPLPFSSAQDYVAACLKGVDGELASTFLQRAGGKFYSIAPVNAAGSDYTDFKHGGFVKAGEHQEVDNFIVQKLSQAPAEYLAAIVKRYVAEKNNSVAIVHEPYLRPGDETPLANSLQSIGSNYFKLFNVRGMSSESLTTEILNHTVSWSFLLLLLKDIPDFSPGEAQYKRVASDAWFIAVGAYDGESYVYWQE